MKNPIKTISASVLFIALIIIAVLININRPTILVLHSYNTDYVWTQGINTGLERILSDNSWLNVSYHYMDTKKQSGQAYLRRASLTARAAIDRINPDILIAFDDYAQKLAARYYVNQPDIRIIFGGINGSVEPYNYDTAYNVTGILERKPVKAVQEMLHLLHNPSSQSSLSSPLSSTSSALSDHSRTQLSHSEIQTDQPEAGTAPPRVVFLADSTYSAHRDAEYISSYNWQPALYKPTIFVETFEQWQQQVLRLQQEADFLLVGPYRKLKRSGQSDEIVSPQEVMHWTRLNSQIQIIGMNVFNSQDGAPISIGVSPYEQGETTAEMAIALLTGTKISRLPIRTSSQYVVSMRRDALKDPARIPGIYEAFARATDNYFE